MADFHLYLGYRTVSSWSMRGWLPLKKTGVAFEETLMRYRTKEGKTRLVELSPTGKVFEPTEENVRSFKEWMKYVRFDQGWIFALGCFMGMGLPALLTVTFISPGTDIGGIAGVRTGHNA